MDPKPCHAELDWLMIPAFLSFLNSASAIFSLFGASSRGQANNGRWLPVSMWCSKLCVGEGVSVSDQMMEGYFARSHLTGSRMVLLTSCSSVLAAKLAAAEDLGGENGFTIGGGVVATTYSDVSGLWSLSNTCACRGRTDSWNFLRKSTLASKNCCVNDLFPKGKVRFWNPQVGILVPFATINLGRDGAADDEQGKMLSVAPESTRNDSLLWLSF